MSLDKTDAAEIAPVNWVCRTGSDLDSTLLQQPPEILKGILDFVDGFALLQLWLCGNTFLNYLIGKGGGCKYFGVDCDAAFFHMKWPSLLYDLQKLEHLRIRLRIGTVFGTLSNPDLQSLPRSLKSIKFAFRTAEETVIAQQPSEPNFGSSQGSTQYINLKEMFPNLQDLILDGDSHILTESIFQFLPPTLTNFQTLSSKVSPGLLPMLFPDTDTLRLPRARGFHDFQALPHALTRLQLTAALTNDNIGDLPRTLYTLVLSGPSSITDEGIKNLPPKLLHLALTQCHLTGAAFRDLPRCMLLVLLSSSSKVSEAELRELPPNLTSLNLPHSVMPALETGCLPSKLTSFVNTCPEHSPTEACVKALPAGLKTFHTWATSFQITHFASLPPTLTKLGLRGISLEMEAEGLALLPRTLLHLEVVGRSGISNEMLVHLPPTLSYLYITQSRLDDQCFSLLPPSLTFLNLPDLSLTRIESVALLPRRLIHLALGTFGSENTDALAEWFPPLLRVISVGSYQVEAKWKQIIRTELSNHPLVSHPVRTIYPQYT